MPNWAEVLHEIQDSLEKTKAKYLQDFHNHTGRNVIVYYSAWLDKNLRGGNSGIIERDRNGFMNCISGLDDTKGLDLIIHTPGGELQATQSIVNYLNATYNGDIRVFVPNTAMSAGTMIACASKEIFMGDYSTLGPVDPQIGGTPAHEILGIFNQMKADLAINQNVAYWAHRMQTLPPHLEGICNSTIAYAEKLVEKWLKGNMLSKNHSGAVATTQYLANYALHNNHGNKLHYNDLIANTSLVINKLESDKILQDKLLSIYHCYTILAQQTTVEVIIENHNSSKYVRNHK